MYIYIIQNNTNKPKKLEGKCFKIVSNNQKLDIINEYKPFFMKINVL